MNTIRISKTMVVASLLLGLLSACSSDDTKADGYGNFEAVTTVVSSEANGKLLQYTVKEGQELKRDEVVALIDTIQLSLKKQQLIASKQVIHAKSSGVLSQISVLKAQLKTAEINRNRIENLVKADAATPQQLDDINGKIDVLNQQIRSIEIQNSSVINELESLDVQLKQLDDQIEKCTVKNPIDGTVLVKYAEPFEVTAFGKPLYKIADMKNMELRVFVSETQLNSLKVGQKVTVKVDAGNSMKKYIGKVTWISSEAEFTPKIIQTKEERVNLVYAVKVTVRNDGGLKIGMPAEMWI